MNAAWRRFADENGLTLPRHALGASYVAECDAAAANGCAEASAVAAAIRALVLAQRDDFRIEYPCHGAQRPRWFQLRITRFGRGGATRLVLAHEEVTELKQTEERLPRSPARSSTCRTTSDGASLASCTTASPSRCSRFARDARASRRLARTRRRPALLDECEALCRTVLQDLRTVSHLLHPPLLDVTGLVPALDWYVRGFATRTGIDVTFRSEGWSGWRRRRSSPLFRVVQESLANVQRHSGEPVRAGIPRRSRDGEVVLVIRGSGQGDPARAGVARGVGVGGCASGSGSSAGRLDLGAAKQRIRAIVPARLPACAGVMTGGLAAWALGAI